jgi:hypothetical protein
LRHPALDAILVPPPVLPHPATPTAAIAAAKVTSRSLPHLMASPIQRDHKARRNDGTGLRSFRE